MEFHQAKNVILIAGVTVLIAVATARVWIAIAPRPSPGSVQEAISRSVSNAAPPEYDGPSPATDIEGLRGRAAEAVRASLLTLPHGERPSDRDATSIARVFADFLVLNRTGSPEHALESYRSRGLEAPRQLRNPDPESRMRSWAYSTAWARHAEIELDTVETQLAYLRGQRIGLSPPGAVIAASRPLRTGGEIFNTEHSLTGYEVMITVVAPNIDRIGEVELVIRVTIVNDGIQGVWDVIQAACTRVPAGKVVLPPLP